MSMFTFGQKFQSAFSAGVTPRERVFGADDSYAVTPADGTDLPFAGSSTVGTRAIYVTGAGNVSCNLSSGGTATLTGLAAGQLVMIAVSRILATGTTATGILALY